MGEVFAGRYTLVDLVGSGGMGAVWRVWDDKHSCYRAAKVLSKSDSVGLLRFVREQSIRIDHPHVVAPLEWAAENDKVLFTMNLVRGGDLAHFIGDFGSLPTPWVALLLDQLLAALEAVHGHGLVHRDVKPANILLAHTGKSRPHLLLGDFGLAASLSEPRLSASSMVCGTPGYLAPEQLRGASPDARQDLYAAGMVGLEMLLGAAWDRADDSPMPEPPVERDLLDVIRTLVADRPEDRYSSATDARAALRRTNLLVASPEVPDTGGLDLEVFDQVPALPEGWDERGPVAQAKPLPMWRRHRWFALAVGGVAATALVTLAALGHQFPGLATTSLTQASVAGSVPNEAATTSTSSPVALNADGSPSPTGANEPLSARPLPPAAKNPAPAASAEAAGSPNGAAPAAAPQGSSPAAAGTFLTDDIDKDGVADLVVHNPYAGAATGFLGNRKAVNAQSALTALNNGKYDLALIADMDGDGRDDLVAQASDGRLVMFRNSGGSYAGSPTTISGKDWQRVNSIVGVDLAADNKADILTRDGSGYVHVYRNTGDGTLGEGRRIAEGWHVHDTLLAADINKDRHTDVLARGRDGYMRVYLALPGKEDLAPPLLINRGWSPLVVFTPTDVNSDGYTDLLTTYRTGERAYYRAVPGKNYFATKVMLP